MISQRKKKKKKKETTRRSIYVVRIGLSTSPTPNYENIILDFDVKFVISLLL